MPIKIPDSLPAKEILQNENIFTMDETRAFHQDIRPLKIAILNLMPDKKTTEVQLLRLIGNSPLQVDVKLMHMESHQSKNTPAQHLYQFYSVFDDVAREKFDGMIITGAPVEHLEYEDVTYWEELKAIMAWTTSNVTSTFHICWGAQAALFYHYGVAKYPLKSKMFGIFPHIKRAQHTMLLRGFDDIFYVPQSRHTEIREEDIMKVPGLQLLSTSEEAGVYLIASSDGRQIFVTGHSEYDSDTLKKEYERDLQKGEKISKPKNYFPNNDPQKPPVVKWKSHANLLFSNWLNYYVYQETPFNLEGDEGNVMYKKGT